MFSSWHSPFNLKRRRTSNLVPRVPTGRRVGEGTWEGGCRISSVGRALDWRVGGRGFDSRGRTNTQGLKMTEKLRHYLCPAANGQTFVWLGWPRKMEVPSSVGDVKIVSPISTFVLNAGTNKMLFLLLFFIIFFLSRITLTAVVFQWVVSLKRVLLEFWYHFQNRQLECSAWTGSCKIQV